MHYLAILFDLDGTLLDTLEDLGQAVNRVLRKRGLPTHGMNEYRRFIGYGSHVLVSRALPEGHRDEETIRDCLQEFQEDYGRNWRIKTRPYSGVPDMLHAISARGLKMAVLSNKRQDFTEKCVAEFLSPWRFEAVSGQRDGVPPKPDPSGALEIGRRLGIAPENFLYLGDTEVDIQTAIDAGMYPAGALWGFHPRKELLESGARTLLERPLDILKLLDDPADPALSPV